MTIVHNLGFSSIGHRRELKTAVEAYWANRCSLETLLAVGANLRARHWYLQKEIGLQLIPVGDFSFYDRMLDTICLLGAVPERFGFEHSFNLDHYFAMARGNDEQPAMEMTKWFDTNYHYIVPEFSSEMTFQPIADRLFQDIEEAQALGIPVKPVLIGPLTFLYLGKEKESGFAKLDLLQPLLKTYQTILTQLKQKGIEWVQIEEPALTMELPAAWLEQLAPAYQMLSEGSPKILLTTYFESVAELRSLLTALPVDGLHLDLVRAPEQLKIYLPDYPANKVLSLGVVDGRNVWGSDLNKTLALVEQAKTQLGERLWIAPSCSLLHVPVDVNQEVKLDAQLKSWLAFGVQRLEEVVLLGKGLTQGKASIAAELEKSSIVEQDRLSSTRIHNPLVQERMAKLDQISDMRISSFAVRQKQQRERLHLPAFPTTTIGSFPQTKTIREARSAFKKGAKTKAEYDLCMREESSRPLPNRSLLG